MPTQKNFEFQTAEPKLAFDIFRPKTPAKAPVVLVIHGGGWSSRSGDMSSICKRLSQEGFLALNLTYRLAPDHVYPAALDDVQSALKYVRANAASLGADPERIYVWGYSAGAHLALLLGMTRDSGIKGIVAGAAPSDLTAYPKSPIIHKFIGATYKERPEVWAQASPINHVSKDTPPVFLYHGKDDRLVGADQSRALKKRLEENGVPVSLHEVGWGMGHILVYLLSKESIAKGVSFLTALDAGK